MPVQRGNYGIPPRQFAPGAPARPMARPLPPQPDTRSMDIIPPRPVQTPLVQHVPPTASFRPAPRPTPSPSASAAEQVSVVSSAPQPLYINRPAPEPAPVDQEESRGVLPKVCLALVVLAALLVLGGGVRWITAGSTAGDLIAAAAVAANDGTAMTIQFTANDGQMHKFTAKSDAKLIPGSAVQVAYKSGAPENSAQLVGPIQAARSLGIKLAAAGAVLFLAAGVVALLMRRPPKHHKSASIAKPVTV